MSVIVMTKNEEHNVGQCLEALTDFAQVFVVDSMSTDRTCDIARAYGREVVEFEWNGRYPKKKQWCLENLDFTYDWVLYVDADEMVGSELAAEIATTVASPKHSGYMISLVYVFLGRELRHGHQVQKLALFDRRRGRYVEWDDLSATNMWEVEGHYQPVIEGSLGSLAGPIVHKDHDTLFRYFERHNRYSDWEATVRISSSGKTSGNEESQRGLRMLAKRVFDRVPMKGLIAFMHSYVIRRGFLDGSAGFNYAIARAMYYWQVGLKMAEVRRGQRT